MLELTEVLAMLVVLLFIILLLLLIISGLGEDYHEPATPPERGNNQLADRSP